MTTFAYGVDNRTAIYDGIGRWTFTYDRLNLRETATDPAGTAIPYGYDARGMISHLTNPQGDRTTFSYDSAGRRTVAELPNGTRTSYTYDAASRVQKLYNLKADGSVILGLSYEHDAVGNATSMLESGGDRVTWTYDATDRLTREQRSGPSAYDDTYTYDPLGNRLLKEASGALSTYAYDLANQLTTSQDATGGTTYTYDLAGNLHVVEQPTGARTTTAWDDQNRQTGVLQPTGAVTTCTYRCDGLRHSKKDSAATTKFIWDFENYLAETDADDEIQAVYTNEPQPYGNLISQYRKGPTLWLPSYYHYDALGATRVLTDDAGDVSDTYVYDAWGNELAFSGSTINPLRWVGQVGYYWDESNGRFYIRARVYEPVIGRWMSQDPVTHGVNLYPYASNSPLTLTDPTGLVPTIKLSLTSFENRACGFIRTAWLMTFNPLKARALMVSHLCYDCTFVDCEKEAGCCTRARRRVDRPGNCIYETFVLQVGEFGFQDHNTHRIYSFQRCSSRGHVAVANNIRIYSYAALEALPEPARSEAMHWEQQALGNRFPRATFTRCGDTVQITSGHSSQPPFWDNAKAIVAATYRSWRIRWDCCNLKTRKQEFEAYTDDRGIRRDIFERNY